MGFLPFLLSACTLNNSPKQLDNIEDRDQRKGRISIPLTATSSSGAIYQLELPGITLSGSQEEINLNLQGDEEFDQALREGQWTMEISQNWSLNKVVDGELVTTDAELTSDNPQAFIIYGGETTLLTISFKTLGGDPEVIEFQSGDLEINIEIDDTPESNLEECNEEMDANCDGINDVTKISSAYYHSCGIDTAGDIRCWGVDSGANDHGQVSDVPEGPFTDVAAGTHHTCALDLLGSVQCWGLNYYGQSSSPEGSFTAISAGEYHNCAIDTEDNIQCWGNNANGSTEAPAGEFVELSTGRWHNCAIDTEGTIQCWGRDDFGQSTPPEGTFTKVSAGSRNSCAIDTDGALICWGATSDGGNYDPTTNYPRTGTFTDVSAGFYHSCATNEDGAVQCWGYQLGGAFPSGTFTQVVSEYHYSCGLDVNGTVQCWGRDGWEPELGNAGLPPADWSDNDGDGVVESFDCDDNNAELTKECDGE